jgi:uncharacterized protein YacL
MSSKTIPALIVVCCAIGGGLMGYVLLGNAQGSIVLLIGGIALGGACVLALKAWLTADLDRLVGGYVGAMAGALLGTIALSGMSLAKAGPEIAAALHGLVIGVLALIGLQLGSTRAKEVKGRLMGASREEARVAGILDTSVIIDGRIADVCETGFITGDLIIPQFVLKELQLIADSAESTKRTRGRRGLDILNKMQKQSFVRIIINDTDYPSAKDVDQKLIQMAKDNGYAIITNDFNLNKVAEVHAIPVLNINRLATAVKPIVLPGETMRVQVLKEGKEAGQGIAYLDDGTMVVIDNGRRFMGRHLEVTVTSVLQTTAGRMIFASAKG